MRGDTGADLWQKIRLRADRIDKIDKTIKELQDKRFILHCEMEELLADYERLNKENSIGCDENGPVKSS